MSQLLGGLGPQSLETFQDLLGGQGAGFEDQFQQGVVQPAMQTYQQDILPALEQRYADVGAGSSSALNQALTRSSEDLSNVLAGQRINYQQGQQQLRQQAQMGALGQIMQLMNARQFQPIVQGPQSGLLQDLMSGGIKLGTGALAGGKSLNPLSWFK